MGCQHEHGRLVTTSRVLAVNDLPLFLTVADTAELAGVSERTAWRDVAAWRAGNEGLPVVQPGGHRRTMVERDVALAYARGQRIAGRRG